MKPQSEYTWNIKHIETEVPNVISFYLKPTKEKPSFIAGQYLTIKLLSSIPAEGKAYSISNAPYEELVRITVRKIGSFSSALMDLKIGDTITTSPPYGFFYPEPDDTELAFIVGGIGITPCLSIIKNLSHQKSLRAIHLLYSNQTESDIVFKDELSSLAEQNPYLSIHYFITRELSKTENYISGRMTPQKIMELIPNTGATEFFLCGSMNFTKAIWKDLHNSSIPQHQLYTEGFF